MRDIVKVETVFQTLFFNTVTKLSRYLVFKFQILWRLRRHCHRSSSRSLLSLDRKSGWMVWQRSRYQSAVYPKWNVLQDQHADSEKGIDCVQAERLFWKQRRTWYWVRGHRNTSGEVSIEQRIHGGETVCEGSTPVRKHWLQIEKTNEHIWNLWWKGWRSDYSGEVFRKYTVRLLCGFDRYIAKKPRSRSVLSVDSRRFYSAKTQMQKALTPFSIVQCPSPSLNLFFWWLMLTLCFPIWTVFTYFAVVTTRMHSKKTVSITVAFRYHPSVFEAIAARIRSLLSLHFIAMTHVILPWIHYL